MVTAMENAYIFYISDVHIGDKGGSFHEKANGNYAGCSGHSFGGRLFPIFWRFAARRIRGWQHAGTSRSTCVFHTSTSSCSSTGSQPENRCGDLQV